MSYGNNCNDKPTANGVIDEAIVADAFEPSMASFELFTAGWARIALQGERP